jgi:hypothetical protein
MRWACCTILIFVSTGCVERRLTVNSDPPGALVYLNGDEVGRTPVTRDFTWYGTYDVELRKEGYQALKTRGKVIAPWWQWPPFDLVAELFPVTDRKQLSYRLSPVSETQEDPREMVERGEKMRGMLESSAHTTIRTPATTRNSKPSE